MNSDYEEGKEVRIIEVSPRDGLQNEATIMSTTRKLELIDAAARAGLRRIEVASFVNPRRVPQMADAGEVVRGTKRLLVGGVNALVLNERGAERAVQAGVDEVTFVMLATETFNHRNQGCSRADSLAIWRDIATHCQGQGIRTTFMVGASFGCPFEGEVSPTVVLELVAAGLKGGADEIALADTIGCAVPTQVSHLFGEVRRLAGTASTRAHFHNTRNTGYVNAFAAIEAGVTNLDASLGGLGGCPFAPNATGNIATEDLAWMLSRAGVSNGVNIAAAAAAANQLERWGYGAPGMVRNAGGFPSEPSQDSSLS